MHPVPVLCGHDFLLSPRRYNYNGINIFSHVCLFQVDCFLLFVLYPLPGQTLLLEVFLVNQAYLGRRPFCQESCQRSEMGFISFSRETYLVTAYVWSVSASCTWPLWKQSPWVALYKLWCRPRHLIQSWPELNTHQRNEWMTRIWTKLNLA